MWYNTNVVINKGDFKMYAIKIDQNSFETHVLESNKKVLVDFYADWCGPCRTVSPLVEQIACEHPEYKVCKINVDEQPQLASEYRITSIPTLLVFENGKVIKSLVGAAPKQQILDMLK